MTIVYDNGGAESVLRSRTQAKQAEREETSMEVTRDATDGRTPAATGEPAAAFVIRWCGA